MPFTRTNLQKFLRASAFILFAIIIVTYAIWRSLNYARGPRIEIFEPTNGEATSTATVTIRGRAERVSFLALNGRAITTDENGDFSDVVLIFPGVNQLLLSAHDQFDRRVTSILTVFGAGQNI